ncbi:uncharacterized protein TNIN_198351 [Trichonephila inaurata madagascariensis]|uniref:Uncharacterized protein n=1 Tax=Trichonephila inaurata madagascariensis TaxID=2747483 RepID=A0A8X6YRC7_9ARAC|nr:uncharacterized protein TNIN_198351 [Trichonephila inaurata madagascariensis]
MTADNTGGLPYELILVLNRPYIITNNIDVADGLSNGSVGKLCYVERDENHDIIYKNLDEVSKTMWTKTSYKIEES